jgi:hypothetical protein
LDGRLETETTEDSRLRRGLPDLYSADAEQPSGNPVVSRESSAIQEAGLL